MWSAIWKERQFKTATGETIKYFREMERLLTAMYCPKEVMHCKRHNRDGRKVAEGNQLADCQARKVALWETPSLQTPLIWTGPVEQEKTQYTEEELSRDGHRTTSHFIFSAYNHVYRCCCC